MGGGSRRVEAKLDGTEVGVRGRIRREGSTCLSSGQALLRVDSEKALNELLGIG